MSANDPDTFVLLKAMCVFINTTTMLLLIMVPKIAFDATTTVDQANKIKNEATNWLSGTTSGLHTNGTFTKDLRTSPRKTSTTTTSGATNA